MADTVLFLDIKSIPGESTISGFVGQIELESITWSLKVNRKKKDTKITKEVLPSKVTVTKFYDKATSNLCQALSQRKRLIKVVLTYASVARLSDGPKAVPIMTITLVDCYIEDSKLNAAESGKSMAVKETVQISFREITINYFPTAASGPGRGAAMTFNFNQIPNS